MHLKMEIFISQQLVSKLVFLTAVLLVPTCYLSDVYIKLRSKRLPLNLILAVTLEQPGLGFCSRSNIELLIEYLIAQRFLINVVC